MAYASPEDEARAVMSFVDDSSRAREEYEPIWQETLQNYLVRPYSEASYNQQVQYPFLTGRGGNTSTSGFSVLKDPESHQVVEALLADEMTLLFGEGDIIRARPVGLEDVDAARTVQAYEHYTFRLEGHYRSLYEWLKDGKIFGLGVLFGYWHYQEGWDAVRSIDASGGYEVSDERPMLVPVYDDYKFRCIDIFDFFWDPGASMLCDMLGAARRFTITEKQARAKVESGEWDRDAVERAIKNKSETDARESRDKTWREGLDRPQRNKPHRDFKPMVGYCYYGEVPYKTKDGISSRRVEVLCGETVRSRPHYGRLPFFAYSPCTIQGRFPGIAPLEVIRYTQDFTDALLMLNADAAAKMIHPPHIVNRYANVDFAKLKTFRPDVPVLSDSIDAVQTLNYSPPLNVTAGFYSSMKGQMREGSGALGALQGVNDGPDRESATGFSGRYRQARGRPEAQAALIEREYLPPLAKHILSQGQRFIESTEDLMRRVGSIPNPVPLASFLGEFDIEFVGSRIEGTRTQRLQAYREIFAQGANPYMAPNIPWAESATRYYKDLGLYEEAALVGTQVAQQTMLAAMQPGNGIGNGNGEIPATPSTALMPEQTGGTVVA